MSETRQPYVNDCMEVNLQLGINGDEADELPNELIELRDEFSAAGAPAIMFRASFWVVAKH